MENRNMENIDNTDNTDNMDKLSEQDMEEWRDLSRVQHCCCVA